MVTGFDYKYWFWFTDQKHSRFGDFDWIFNRIAWRCILNVGYTNKRLT